MSSIVLVCLLVACTTCALLAVDTSSRGRAAKVVVRFAGAVYPRRRDEFQAELDAIQWFERETGFDYAVGALFGAAVERADNARREITVRNVSKSYGPTVALRDVSMSFASGKVTALMGGNGAGKSTLLKLLAGEDAAQHGTITFGDVAVSSGTPAGISVLRRDFGLIENFTVATNIAFGQSTSWVINGRRERQQAVEALRAVSSTIDPDRLAADLSPAERLQVLLAREVHKGANELLVLDEPTAGLSTTAAQGVYDSIKACGDLGFGVIMVSHRIDQVFRVADHVAVLYDGSLVLDSAIEDTSIDEVLAEITGSSSPAAA